METEWPLSVTKLLEAMEQNIDRTPTILRKDPKCIPIVLNGGAGDVIMSIPTAIELEKFGKIEIYTRYPVVYNYFKSEEMPKAQPGEIQYYNWCVILFTAGKFYIGDDFTGFDNHDLFALRLRQIDLLNKHDRLRILLNDSPHKDMGLAHLSKELGIRRWEMPAYTLGLPRPNQLKWPREKPDKYITIHDGYESGSGPFVNGRATKQWKWSHWNKIVKALKKSYPDFRIVQLGVETARPIDGVDDCLVNQTTLIEAFEIIKHAALHIDGDSGLVHAATVMSVPCVVLFGPTPDYYYGYPENANLRSKACADACYWLKPDWLNKCPIGLNAPKCMDDIEPEEVMLAAKKFLG